MDTLQAVKTLYPR